MIAEYDFVGMNRMARRDHDEGSGFAGNDTRVDLWHGTTGQYDGLDRFGRGMDAKSGDHSVEQTATPPYQRYTVARRGSDTPSRVWAARAGALVVLNAAAWWRAAW